MFSKYGVKDGVDVGCVLSDWGGAVGLRGSHARHQQQGRSGGPQLLDTMSLQLQVFKKSTLWMGFEESHICIWIRVFPWSREQDETIGGGCICVFLSLCIYVAGHMYLLVSIYPLHYVCACICACWEYVHSFTSGWAWEHGAAAATSLLACRTWYTPAKPCRRADVTVELLTFVSSRSVWLSKH